MISERRNIDAADPQSAIASLGPWFHNLHLPNGLQTAPDHWLGDFPAHKWERLGPHLPDDLQGWTALDLGCNAGFYSFELARRGALVRAADSDPHYLRQARWAAAQYTLESRVTFESRQVYEFGRRGETFDLVLFMGLFYHLRYPLLGLEVAARCTRRLLVFQSLMLPERDPPRGAADLPLDENAALAQPGWPRMAFVEQRLQKDPTNWWVPNRPCVEALLRSAGMHIISVTADETFICVPRTTSSEVADQDLQQFQAALGITADL